MNKKQIIGFDMDGVIINHTAPRIRLAARYGWMLTPKQTPSEIIKTVLPKPILDELKHKLYDDPKTSLLSPAMPGVKAALAAIKKQRTPYVLISRRKNHELAIALLKKRGLWPTYFHEGNAFFVSEPEDKNVKAAELGVTHYVDDEIGILEKLPDVEHKFLFDHLGVFDGVDSYKRVTSWPELMSRLFPDKMRIESA